MRRWLPLCVLAVACGAPWGSAAAQDSSRDTTQSSAGPYTRLTLGLAGGRAVADGYVDRYWTSAGALRVDVHTNFYAGDIGAFAVTLPYRARSTEQPDYRAYIVGLDWRFTPGDEWLVHPVVSASAGNYLMSFDGVETKGLKKESEIFVGGSAGLAARVHRGTHLTAMVTGIRVLTSTPIRSAFATVGIAQTVATPRWMSRVFE